MKTTLKQTIALLCTLVLLFGLCACSSKTAEPAEAASPSGTGSGTAALPAAEPAPEPAPEMEPTPSYTPSAEEPMPPVEAESASLLAPGAAADAAEDTGEAPGIPEARTDQAEAFVLTAAEWNDNENWPFFTNLVNSGKLTFPSYGVDPRGRVKVTLTDDAGTPLPGETVKLQTGDAIVWEAKTDKNGVAFLFHDPDAAPTHVLLEGDDGRYPLEIPEGGDAQNPGQMRPADELTIVRSPRAAKPEELQVMFIVDTTGSMGDELAYLQKDFNAIAEDAGSDGVRYSVNFYRDEGDEYVTRCNPFTADIGEVHSLINAEYADGGGDTPEAVAEILTETMAGDAGWSDSAAKLAFLIFDAPPHYGREQALVAAVRAAAAKGIRVVPVVASNADRETELFGRALAICTGGTYVFLTDDSGVGDEHLEPIVGDHEVELLHDVIVRIINENKVG